MNRHTLLLLISVAVPLGLSAAATPSDSLRYDRAPVYSDSVATASFLRDGIPAAWQYTSEYSQPDPVSDKWWQSFRDPILDSLIARAEANNFNVAMALKRIDIARQQLNQTKAGYWPTLNASAGWSISQNAGAVANPVAPSSTTDYFSVGLQMNWEIDVFGRIRAGAKADKAAIDVSRADYDAVIVSLCANVATTYMQLRTYQAQYNVAIEHIASQERILKIAQARFEAGIGDMLEVTQARIVLMSTQATIPALESSIRTSANALAVLTGEYPSALTPLLLKPAPIPSNPGMANPGIPAELLRRRPDVVEAEMQVARYAALVGVAKKDFLPTLSLTGSIATSAHKINNLFGAHSLEYSVAPTLSWTVFDGLARNYRTAEAKLNMEQSIDNYNLTVINAVEEVEDAISRYNAKVRESQILTGLMEESRKSLDLSLDLYKQGLTDFRNVADAQMSYLQNENSFVESKAATLAALVSIYKALGGGW